MILVGSLPVLHKEFKGNLGNLARLCIKKGEDKGWSQALW